MWLLPISMLVFTTLLSIPLSRYLAWIMDGKYHAPDSFGGSSTGSIADLKTGSSTRLLF